MTNDIACPARNDNNGAFIPGAAMPAPKTDLAFTGSVAQLYERYMVPLIFEPYAVDMARRVAEHGPRRVLEIAAGTGVVTRQLAAMLDG